MRRIIAKAAPSWARKKLARMLDYFDLIFIDHHIFRFLYSNRHRVAPGVYRSSQPAPYQIRRFKRRGIKTIINLRGERDCGSYRLEAATCRRHGIRLIDFPLQSRGLPTLETLRQAQEIFHDIEYPVLMHCKSGADRVGLMSALYLILKENRPPEEAIRQLSLKYGHFKQADTGILDYFLESYIEHNKAKPTPFLEWAKEWVSDRRKMKREFASRSWANVLVNSVLGRE